MGDHVMTDLVAEILALKAERRAAIVGHNYQSPEIRDVADVVTLSGGISIKSVAIAGPAVEQRRLLLRLGPLRRSRRRHGDRCANNAQRDSRRPRPRRD